MSRLRRLHPYRRLIVCGTFLFLASVVFVMSSVFADFKHSTSSKETSVVSGRAGIGIVASLLISGLCFWFVNRICESVENEQSEKEKELSRKFLAEHQELVCRIDQTFAQLVSHKQTTEETAQQAELQSQHVLEVTATIEELSFATTDIAKSAMEAARIANETMESAIQGAGLSETAAQTVRHVSEFARELDGTVGRLSRRVSEIGQILTFVKDVADQTKLLALNASIEAAREGGHGTGFSVVAQEVRRLADLTVRETAQISARIRSVEQETVRTNQTMQKTATQVEDILGSVQNVLHTLTSIVEISGKSKERIGQIAEAVELQSRAMNRISTTMEQASQIAVDISKKASDARPGLEKAMLALMQIRNAPTLLETNFPNTPNYQVSKT